MRILVIEDEIRLAEALQQILEKEKYMVDIVHNGQDGFDYASSGIYDAIIMDVMIPSKNGFQLTADLRKAGVSTPIIMLTARDSLDDKVEGLDRGADDYMTKPFAPQELLARLRALTRRQGEVVVDTMQFGDLALDLSSCTLSAKGKSTHLSFKEFEIMKLLLSGSGNVIGKEEILVKVWGYDGDATENNVEAYISFLRKKLNFIETEVEIASLRKMGYKLERKSC